MLRFAFFVMVCLVFPGCAGRGDLKGNVSYQGKLLQTGTVQAAGSDGMPRFSIIKDSAYDIKDLPAGPIRITVTSPDPWGLSVGMRKQDEQPPPRGDRTGWFAIPGKYADFKTSGLTFDLQRGQNTLDIKLD